MIAPFAMKRILLIMRKVGLMRMVRVMRIVTFIARLILGAAILLRRTGMLEHAGHAKRRHAPKCPYGDQDAEIASDHD